MTVATLIARARGNSTATHRKKYRALMRKDAGGAQLTSQEVAQLDTATAELGISTAQMQDDTAALRRHAELAEQLKNFDRDMKASLAKQRRLSEQFNTEFSVDAWNEYAIAWRVKKDKLRREIKDLTRQALNLQIAREEMIQLGQEPRLFSDASQDVLAESKRKMQQAKAGHGWV